MKRPSFAGDFKVEGVKLVHETGVSVAARDLDVHENVLRNGLHDFEPALRSIPELIQTVTVVSKTTR